MARYADHVDAEVIGGARDPKKTYLGVSIVELVIGIILLIWPVSSVVFVCVVMGAALAVGGILAIAQVPGPVGLGIGVSCIVGGLFLIFGNWLFVTLIPVIFGIILLVSGINKIVGGADMHKYGSHGWVGVLAGGVIMVVLACVLLFNPFSAAEVIMRLVGAFMMVNAIINMWFLHERRNETLFR